MLQRFVRCHVYQESHLVFSGEFDANCFCQVVAVLLVILSSLDKYAPMWIFTWLYSSVKHIFAYVNMCLCGFLWMLLTGCISTRGGPPDEASVSLWDEWVVAWLPAAGFHRAILRTPSYVANVRTLERCIRDHSYSHEISANHEGSDKFLILTCLCIRSTSPRALCLDVELLHAQPKPLATRREPATNEKQRSRQFKLSSFLLRCLFLAWISNNSSTTNVKIKFSFEVFGLRKFHNSFFFIFCRCNEKYGINHSGLGLLRN